MTRDDDITDMKYSTDADSLLYRTYARRIANKDKTLAKKLEKVADSAKEVVDYIKTREG